MESGRGAVNDIAGANLFRAGLEKVLHGGFPVPGPPPEDREDGADADVHVDVRGAVERIVYDDVLTVVDEFARDRDEVVHLLAGQADDRAGVIDRAADDVVRKLVETILADYLGELAVPNYITLDNRTFRNVAAD